MDNFSLSLKISLPFYMYNERFRPKTSVQRESSTKSYKNTRNGFLLKSRLRLFQSMQLVKTFLLFLQLFFTKKKG